LIFTILTLVLSRAAFVTFETVLFVPTLTRHLPPRP
jgi:hypothetical protein